MTIKTILYPFSVIVILTFLYTSANQPLYVNSKEIPIHLAAIARSLLNVSKATIMIQIEPSKYEELLVILARYEQLLNLNGQTIAVNKNLLLDLLKKKIFP